MAWIRRYKQKKLISKISVDSNFTFSSYAWLCVFHCSHRLLCWIKSRVRDFSVKIALISRGCARGGHGVIGAHFAKMTPNFGFLVAFEGHSWPPSFLTLWNSWAGNDPQSLHFQTSIFWSLAAPGVIHDAQF